jgi:transposase
MALVEMSIVEQRYRAVLAVGRGEPKIVVAAQFGVSRQTLHTWLTRYARDGLAGLIDRTHRPPSCAHQAGAEVEARVCELRREHPRWGPGGSPTSWPAPPRRAARCRQSRRCIASCAATS